MAYKHLTLLMMLLTLSGYSMASIEKYDPTELEQYQKTGICEKCNLSDADVAYSSAADLQGSDITQSTLVGQVYMQNSNFSYVIATDSNLSAFHTDLSGSNFTGAELGNAEFGLDDLSNCNFTNADLKGAVMTGANLTNAIMSDAQIEELANDCDAIMPDGVTHGTKC